MIFFLTVICAACPEQHAPDQKFNVGECDGQVLRMSYSKSRAGVSNHTSAHQVVSLSKTHKMPQSTG